MDCHSNKNEMYDVVIVGGGICGLASAVALHREGIRSILLEKSKTLRATGAAMITQPNGWRALDHLGVGSILREKALYLNSGEAVSVVNGKRFDLPFGGGESRCLKRTDLVEALAAQLPSDVISCGRGVVSMQIDPKTSDSILQIDDGSTVIAKIVIGCDGVNSVVANTVKLNPMQRSPNSVIRGFTYYENGHDFLPEFLIWTSENKVGHLPITNNLMYWFITRKRTSEDLKISSNQDLIKDSALESVKGCPPNVVEMVKNCDVNSLNLTSIKYRTPWDLLTTNFRKGRVIVVGDAMHAMGPFLAQGGGASLEDAVIVAKCLSKALKTTSNGLYPHMTIEQALDKCLELRKRRVFWISLQTHFYDTMFGTSYKLMKFLCMFLLLVLFKDQKAHTRFDCRTQLTNK